MNRLYTEYTSRATWKLIDEILENPELYTAVQNQNEKITPESIREVCEIESAWVNTLDLDTVDWQQVADEINHDLGYGLPEAYPTRYAIKISMVAVDKDGREIEEVYPIFLNNASTDYQRTKNCVDLLIERAEEDYNFDSETDSDRLGFEETEKEEGNG